jgi:hypothetical protein
MLGSRIYSHLCYRGTIKQILCFPLFIHSSGFPLVLKNLASCLTNNLTPNMGTIGLIQVIDYYSKKGLVANLPAEKPPKEVTVEVQKALS